MNEIITREITNYLELNNKVFHNRNKWKTLWVKIQNAIENKCYNKDSIQGRCHFFATDP